MTSKSAHGVATFRLQPRTRRSLTQLGGALRKARLDAGLSQEQLGRLAGVSRQLVSRVEVGSPRGEIGRVVQIAEALGLRVVVEPMPHRGARSQEQQAIEAVFDRIRQGNALPSQDAPARQSQLWS